MTHSDPTSTPKRRDARARRRRQLRRQRITALIALGAAIVSITLIAISLISPATQGHAGHLAELSHDQTQLGSSNASHAGEPERTVASAGTYGVGTLTLHLVDATRTITLPGGSVVPRPVTTVVRFPTLKPSHRAHGSPAGQPPAAGRFPLIVFGHGFDIMPSAYARLLRYWASAGFIVATPIFPLENPAAPGGPNESDLPNQPADMRFVISSLQRLSDRRVGRLAGHIQTNEVAVAGHSDGGDTALALAYDPTLRDPDLQAAVILSGAEIPMLPMFTIHFGGPPLLATQGTADVVNLPSATSAFFDSAPRPKFLLQLPGGTHIGPYTSDRPELTSVERVTTSFLQYYLEHEPSALPAMRRAGNVAGVATLHAFP